MDYLCVQRDVYHNDATFSVAFSPIILVEFRTMLDVAYTGQRLLFTCRNWPRQHPNERITFFLVASNERMSFLLTKRAICPISFLT